MMVPLPFSVARWEKKMFRAMLPWFFSYDRVNYARYLPVYWIEMVDLQRTHPACHQETLVTEQWTVQRQYRHPFSSISCDQAIEQMCNRDSKTSGGLTGITLKPGAIQRWILAQPERAAIARQCEVMVGMSPDCTKRKGLYKSQVRKDDQDVQSINHHYDWEYDQPI